MVYLVTHVLEYERGRFRGGNQWWGKHRDLLSTYTTLYRYAIANVTFIFYRILYHYM